MRQLKDEIKIQEWCLLLHSESCWRTYFINASSLHFMVLSKNVSSYLPSEGEPKNNKDSHYNKSNFHSDGILKKELRQTERESWLNTFTSIYVTDIGAFG